jgi:hypothetical protein
VSLFLADRTSAQPLASEPRVGDYVCVVGDDKQMHAIVPKLSAEEKTFFMTIERNSFSSDPAMCTSPRDMLSGVMCHAQFQMTMKKPTYYFWSDGYQFHDIDGGGVI